MNKQFYDQVYCQLEGKIRVLVDLTQIIFQGGHHFQRIKMVKIRKGRKLKGLILFDYVQMYHFNRILGVTYAKKTQSFTLFAKEQQKTQIVIHDFNTKKIADYDLPGAIKNVQLSEKGQLFTISPNTITIYSIISQHKNRLDKINELDINAQFIVPFNNFLLIKKESSFILLDGDFECVIKEELSQDQSEFKVIKVDKDKFLLKTTTKLQMWDTAAELTSDLHLPPCYPNLCEYVDGKIIVADQWIEAFDLKKVL